MQCQCNVCTCGRRSTSWRLTTAEYHLVPGSGRASIVLPTHHRRRRTDCNGQLLERHCHSNLHPLHRYRKICLKRLVLGCVNHVVDAVFVHLSTSPFGHPCVIFFVLVFILGNRDADRGQDDRDPHQKPGAPVSHRRTS